MEYELHYLPFEGDEADQMRARIRFDEYVPSLGEVGDLWDEVTSGSLDAEESGEALSHLWEAYNRGPGGYVREMDEKEMRSLSAGDIVVLDGDAYLCAPFGWEELEGDES